MKIRHTFPTPQTSRFQAIASALVVFTVALALTSTFHPLPTRAATPAEQNTPPTASLPPSGTELFSLVLQSIAQWIEPSPQSDPQTISILWAVTHADGQSKNIANLHGQLAFQAPDKLTVSTTIDKRQLQIGRNGQTVWVHAPDKKFGVVGKPGLPRFLTAPEKIDTKVLEPFKLPVPREQIALLALLCEARKLEPVQIESIPCDVLSVTPRPEAIQALKVPQGTLTLWVRKQDHLPIQLQWEDAQHQKFGVVFKQLEVTPPVPEERWNIPSRPEDKIETTALSHLTRALPAALSLLNSASTPLGPAQGSRKLLATEGQGRLEIIDDTRVLILSGTPEEMGRQHGILLKKSVRDLVERVLYGVGVGSSFEKGRWFFGEIEEAQARLMPHMDSRYLREMDAIASAAKLDREEVRLANFFPELFHCSGFAVYGKATQDGKLYHGRILDYMRGVGLEPNAVVMVLKPDQGNAWVNISYAGFVGSVTAMNEKKIAIGEMGGRGEGQWDGKPMAQLVREVMEKANNLEEAVAIMRKGPRTCEYYYVISDGNTRQAVGIAATPTTFEVIRAGESHPRLPHAIDDAVLMSAGDRYEHLAQRVQGQHGKLDATSSRDLMTRPVCMTSNIHSVLFAPESLDFWVANADSKNVASHARYTHYNLADLLQPVAHPATSSNGAKVQKAP